jgi:hypothetical protein
MLMDMQHNGLFKIHVRRLSLLEYHSHKLLKDVWFSPCIGCLPGLTVTSSTFRYLRDMSLEARKKLEK